jgi:hypothetical protein
MLYHHTHHEMKQHFSLYGTANQEVILQSLLSLWPFCSVIPPTYIYLYEWINFNDIQLIRKMYNCEHLIKLKSFHSDFTNKLFLKISSTLNGFKFWNMILDNVDGPWSTFKKMHNFSWDNGLIQIMWMPFYILKLTWSFYKKTRENHSFIWIKKSLKERYTIMKLLFWFKSFKCCFKPHMYGLLVHSEMRLLLYIYVYVIWLTLLFKNFYSLM